MEKVSVVIIDCPGIDELAPGQKPPDKTHLFCGRVRGAKGIAVVVMKRR